MKKVKRKGNKNNAYKAVFGTFMIFFIAIMVLLITNILFPFRRLGQVNMTSYFMISNLISFTLLVISIYLIYIYLKDYLELKSNFTLGILLSVISFMLFAMTSNPLLHQFFGVYGKMGLFSMMSYLFATISLAILAWVSSK